MNNIEYFFWLSGQAISGLIYGWPVTVALIGFLGAGVLCVDYDGRIRWRHFSLLVVLQALCPPAILMSGTIWHEASPRIIDSVWIFLLALVTFQLVVAYCALRTMKGARSLALSSSLVVFWCSFWAYFVAAMSIADDWI